MAVDTVVTVEHTHVPRTKHVTACGDLERQPSWFLTGAVMHEQVPATLKELCSKVSASAYTRPTLNTGLLGDTVAWMVLPLCAAFGSCHSILMRIRGTPTPHLSSLQDKGGPITWPVVGIVMHDPLNDMPASDFVAFMDPVPA